MSLTSNGLLSIRYYAGLLMTLAVSQSYEITCPEEGDGGPWVTPGTLCHSYFYCKSGHPIISHCPHNAFFNTQTQECGTSGSCYEVVCTGRMDGAYLDITESCTRSYWCLGGRLVKIGPPHTRNKICSTSSAAKIVFRHNRCKDKQDGRYSENDNCSGYYECEDRTEKTVVTCPKGSIFDGQTCVYNARCCNNICSKRTNGYHTDPSTYCTQYVECFEGAIKERLSCPADTGFNGVSCVPRETFFCPGIDKCSTLEDGFHLESCQNYIKCENSRTLFSAKCEPNESFNGVSCISNKVFQCNQPYFSKICIGKDGFYTNHTSGCSSYYYCARDGKKVDFTCPRNYVFNGTICISFELFTCPLIIDSCEDKSEGYYLQRGTRCQVYFYCLNSSKITYFCPTGMLFNGEKCVQESSYNCLDDIASNDLSGPCS